MFLVFVKYFSSICLPLLHIYGAVLRVPLSSLLLSILSREPSLQLEIVLWCIPLSVLWIKGESMSTTLNPDENLGTYNLNWLAVTLMLSSRGPQHSANETTEEARNPQGSSPFWNFHLSLPCHHNVANSILDGDSKDNECYSLNPLLCQAQARCFMWNAKLRGNIVLPTSQDH